MAWNFRHMYKINVQEKYLNVTGFDYQNVLKYCTTLIETLLFAVISAVLWTR